MLRFSTLCLALVLAAASHARAGEIAGVSHRSRLYDSAARGSDVYVVGYPGLVLKSSDRGQHFAPISVPTQDALFSIDINRAGVGAIVGRSGLVLVTTDGGSTWSKTNALAATQEGEDKPHLFAVDVLDSGVIVAVGDFATIVQSSDRGKTWEKRSFDPTDPGAAEQEGGAPRRANENEGFESEARLTGVSFGDEKHGFVVGEFGIVIATDDGGASWKRQHSATDKLLFSVHAVDAKHVVAAGSDGTIAETRDGKSWTIVRTPTTNHLFGVWASSDVTLAVGADGTVIRRGGRGGFQQVPTSVHTWLSSVALTDAVRGVIAGGLGHMLTTDDSGQRFQVLVGE